MLFHAYMLMGGRLFRLAAQAGCQFPHAIHRFSFTRNFIMLSPIKFGVKDKSQGKSCRSTTEPREERVLSRKLDWSSLPSSDFPRRVWKSATPLYLWRSHTTASSSLLSELWRYTKHDKIQGTKVTIDQYGAGFLTKSRKRKQFWMLVGLYPSFLSRENLILKITSSSFYYATLELKMFLDTAQRLCGQNPAVCSFGRLGLAI